MMNTNKVILYGFDECPYCDKLKDKYNEGNIKYDYVNINTYDGKELKKLFTIAKTDSVPIILINKSILSPEISFKSIDEAYNLTIKILDNNN